MKTIALTASTLVAALAASSSMACGEGQFNMGQGMRYQAYLAPQPATVLIYADDAESSPGRRATLIQGLRQSGHQVTEVHDEAGFKAALVNKKFDVLVASYADIDAISASASATGALVAAVIPVVQRKQRNDPELRERFNAFLLTGASLGQYLKSINSVLPAANP